MTQRQPPSAEPGSAWQSQAIEHIKCLKAAYFRTLDAKLWDDFSQLFAPDCEFIIYRDSQITEPKRRFGRDEIVASVRRTVGEALTKHDGHLETIDVLSRKNAEAVWEMTDYIEAPQGASVKILRGSGRYYERYRFLDKRWMISRLELRRTSLVKE
jgi:hypothetical protein